MPARPPSTYELYRWAVQDPQLQVTFLSMIYEHYAGRRPRYLREDFAGNGADAVEWALRGGEAVAVDLDGRALRWGARRARRLLGDNAGRVHFVEADVRAIRPPRVPPVDVIAALNFSTFVFHARAEMLAYFRAARRGLALDGALVLTAFGGPAQMRPRRHRRVIRRRALYAAEPAPAPFEYVWEQRSYDPLTARLDCRLHFVVRGPGRQRRTIENAFRYDCRLWGLAELLELLQEAGFRQTAVWQHRNRGRGGVFEPVTRLRGDKWVAYVVGLR
jgi:SAM-dependent methyltransferase